VSPHRSVRVRQLPSPNGAVRHVSDDTSGLPTGPQRHARGVRASVSANVTGTTPDVAPAPSGGPLDASSAIRSLPSDAPSLPLFAGPSDGHAYVDSVFRAVAHADLPVVQMQLLQAALEWDGPGGSSQLPPAGLERSHWLPLTQAATGQQVQRARQAQ
jgi:hypothetical protein